ncbi:DUF4244 domain-containing protein [Changpingibacter yushuensis]|uniref:DUF4244 domain-containing protein n=1 Tax=Changpingibacter yushuensis TaxID=2758440 RepID=UPI00165D80D3|nr:DUF4244 domain-containing protein [Changpingibacter yushuensis]
MTATPYMEPSDEFSSESGMATAEYAIGTLSASTFAGLLLWLVKQDWVRDALESIFKSIFSF